MELLPRTTQNMRRTSSLSVSARVALMIAAGLSLSVAAGARASDLGATTAPIRAVLLRDLTTYLQRRSAAEHLSSLSLTVSLNRDRPPINITVGTTHYHGDNAVTPASLYQIGSNTKAFTAVAVLQLEAQHRLSIDEPIGEYLPQYRAYRQLTLSRLLNMTAGLESYDNTPSWEKSYAAHPTANVPADALIRLVYPSIAFPPGTKYHYSNTGYLIAQKVVDARGKSGSFATEMARIIASVHLHDTFYTSHLYAPPIARRVVAGYYENNDAGFGRFLGTDMSGYSLSWAQAAGSIVSTPADLAVWARAQYEGTTLLPAAQKKTLKPYLGEKCQPPGGADCR